MSNDFAKITTYALHRTILVGKNTATGQFYFSATLAQRVLVGSCKVSAMHLDVYAGVTIKTKMCPVGHLKPVCTDKVICRTTKNRVATSLGVKHALSLTSTEYWYNWPCSSCRILWLGTVCRVFHDHQSQCTEQLSGSLSPLDWIHPEQSCR